MGYTKLFSDIVASSIWDEDDKTRLVWITMLALKDRYHFVRGTERYLALAARVTLEQCQESLRKLKTPDKGSRSKEFDGRRIEDADGGWTVLNGEKYGRKLSLEERREYNRIKQAEYRAKRVPRQEPLNGEAKAIRDLESGKITQEQFDERAASSRERGRNKA